MSSLQKTNQSLLLDLKSVLFQLQPAEYAMPLPVFEGISIGQHVRHIIEFFQCLLAVQGHQVVNYDLRKRDLEIEQNVNYCLHQIDLIINDLDEKSINFAVLVKIDLENNYSADTESSFERELGYLVEHTIHHLAIIKIGLNHHFKNVTIPAGFGLAYSTQRFAKMQLSRN